MRYDTLLGGGVV